MCQPTVGNAIRHINKSVSRHGIKRDGDVTENDLPRSQSAALQAVCRWTQQKDYLSLVEGKADFSLSTKGHENIGIKQHMHTKKHM